MTKKDFFEFAKDFFNECLRISEKKNADYTGIAADPFANFTAVEAINLDTVDGFLTRMMDKMQRVSSFNKMGQLQVKDESVTDTLRDLANYSCLLAGYIKSKGSTITVTLSPGSDIPPIDKPMREFSKTEQDELVAKFEEPGLKFPKKQPFYIHKSQADIMYKGAQNAYDSPKLKGNPDELRKYPFAPDECQESPDVSLQNTKDVFIPSESRETGRTTIGVYNGVKAVMTPNGTIWPYLMADDLGNGPGNPVV